MEKHTGNYGEEHVEVFPARETKSSVGDGMGKTEKKDKSDKSDKPVKSDRPDGTAPLTAGYKTPLTDTHAGQSKRDGAAKNDKGEK